LAKVGVGLAVLATRIGHHVLKRVARADMARPQAVSRNRGYRWHQYAREAAAVQRTRRPREMQGSVVD
jgi:hypothetical protein